MTFLATKDLNEEEKPREHCDCGTYNLIEMDYIGEIAAQQIWQCPECKKIRITNY